MVFMKKKHHDQEPTIAPGMDDGEELDREATNEEMKKVNIQVLPLYPGMKWNQVMTDILSVIIYFKGNRFKG